MDDLNRRIMEERRKAAIEAQAKRDAEAAQRAKDLAEEAEEASTRPPPSGAGKLSLQRRQGEWRYYLGEHRVRVGDVLEFYLDPKTGWVRGIFQWGRRNTSPPTIRLVLRHPDAADLFLGEAVVSLPEEAILRWPEESP